MNDSLIDENTLYLTSGNIEEKGRSDAFTIKVSENKIEIEVVKDVEFKIIRRYKEKAGKDFVLHIKDGLNVRLTDVFAFGRASLPCAGLYVCGKNVCFRHNLVMLPGFLSPRKIDYRINSLSTLEVKGFACSTADTDFQTNVYLLGIGASVDAVNSLIAAKTSRQNHLYNVYHCCRETTSNLINYAIAKDEARLVLKSSGTIKKGCAASSLKQLAKGIILGDGAKAEADPILLIDEFDVSAKHGASIGEINDEDLFYLMSRGLSHEESVRLILNAYLAPVLDDMTDVGLKKHIYELLKE